MPTRIGSTPTPTTATKVAGNSAASAPSSTSKAAKNAPAGAADSFEPAKANTAKVALDAKPSFVGKVKDKAVAVLWNEATKEHSFKLADLALGDYGVAAIKSFEQILQPSNALVAGDPQRTAYDAQTPGKHAWVRTGGLLDANLGLSLPISVGAGGNIGFSGSGALEYSMVAPYALNGSGALDLGKNMTVDLPVTAKNALAMQRGAEFSLRGSGAVGASAAVTVGAGNWRLGPLNASASASVGATAGASGQITLNVKRLDGDKVYVRIGKADAESAGSSISASAGVSVDRAEAGEYLDQLPAGAINDFLEKTATNESSKQVEKLLKFQASASASASRSSQQVAAYVLDLSTVEGKAAYEALVKLDTGPAARLAENGQAVRAVYDETVTGDSSSVRAQLGPAKLLLIDAARRDREGRLDGPNGTIDVRQSLFSKQTDGLLAGKRSVLWEGVSWKRDGQQEETYFHLNFQKHDGATRQSEVDEFRRFAQGVDAKFDGPGKADEDKGFWSGLFNGAYGETDLKLDMYLTRSGLQQVAQAPEEKVLQAFAEAAQKLEGAKAPPAWSVPSQAAEARRLMEEYRSPSAGEGDQKAGIEAQYSAAFGRDISTDIEDLESAQTLAKGVAGMRGKSEDQWAKVFADLGSASRFDFWKQAVALNALATSDQTLVHELSIKGQRIDLAARDEGARTSIDAEIGKALAPP